MRSNYLALVAFVFLVFLIAGCTTIPEYLAPIHESVVSDLEHGEIEVHIIASQEDMNSGQYFVEFREYMSSGGVDREVKPGSGRGVFTKGLNLIPYVQAGKGSTSVDRDAGSITFELRPGNNQVICYGYRVKPSGETGSGYCGRSFVALPIRDVLDFYMNTQFKRITVVFDTPASMEVFAPWKQTGERRYEFARSSLYLYADTIFKAGYAYWGNFDNVETQVFGPHTLNILTYGDADPKYAELAGKSYAYMMRIFEDNWEFLMAQASLVFVDPEIICRGEGSRGVLLERAVPVPKIGKSKNHSHYHTDEYYNIIDIDQGFGAICIHEVVHATFDDIIGNSWGNEGIAVFYQLKLLGELGLADEELVEREFIEILRYYQEEIVARNQDIPLEIVATGANGEQDEWRKAYGIAMRPGYSNGNLRPGERLGVQGDYFHKSGWGVSSWFAYRKGSLIFYLLNRIVGYETDGEKDLADLLRVIAGNISRNPDPAQTEFMVESAIFEITGVKYNDFFEKYIHGVEPLPLRIDGKSIQLTL